MQENDAEITLEKLIVEVIELVNEIKNEQSNAIKMIEKNHKVNMKCFSKLREYNEIADMTNQVFERRILNIEQMIHEALKQK